MRTAIRTVTLAVVLLGAGLILGDAPDTIVIPHDVHLDNEIACGTCHGDVAGSTSGLSTHRPDMDVCADCHDTDDEDLCAQCHTNVDAAGAPATEPSPGWNFSHAIHLGVEMACADCHGDLAVAAPRLPAKDLCRSCHETADAYADCRVCHAESEDLAPAGHDGGWLHFHGIQARLDQNRCDACHTRSQCQDCHAGDNVAPRSHDLDFMFGHAIEARGNETDCMTCHTDPQYCGSCHMAERVIPRSHVRADWIRMPDGGRHAEDGLFELENCVACHDAGGGSPACARCHGG
ncbi:hypothetical protein H8E07_17005 [bacterium]|nr:hypothetical protein [bacterium]